MAMTRKEFLASAASVGALSACAGKVIVLAAVAFLAFAGMCGERYWLPRANSLRAVTNGTDTSTLTLTALASFGAVQRDVSFLPDTKERGPLVHSTGDVCKVAMGLKLPYDEELEWIKGDGNQYIILPSLIGGSSSSYEVRIIPFYTSTYKHFFGGNFSSLPISNIYTINNYLWFETRYTGTPKTAYKYTFQSGTSDLIIKAENGLLKVNNSNLGSIPCLGWGSSNWYFFTSLSENKPDTAIVYYLKATKDGVLIIDIIPVLNNGIPCFYNRYDGVFYYNQVSGHQFGYKKKDGTIVAPY